MSIRPFTAYVAECDCVDDALCDDPHSTPCGVRPDGGGGPIWYVSRKAAAADLDLWDWLVDGEQVYCPECARRCGECLQYHGAHAAGCLEAEDDDE